MIHEITVLSGKGGTGKTSISAAFASVAKNIVITDCDVDAADLHLLLKPQIQESYAFDSGSKAFIHAEKCTACGICEEACRFDAIHHNDEGKYVVDPYNCEGCRLCERICPAEAIDTIQSLNNYWYVSETRFGPMVHAAMSPGEENSGKLVSTVRSKAREIARKHSAKIILNDGPPGIGCPVIASITGVHGILLVAEPSKTGIHDISRVAGLCRKFKIPAYAIINKYNLNQAMSLKAEKLLQSLNIPLIGKIDFDEDFVRAMLEAKTIVEFNATSASAIRISEIWDTLLDSIPEKLKV